jgi:uncharacterized protein (TIGR03083 family)
MTNPAPRTGTQLDKADVLPGLFASWDAIIRLVTALPESQWLTATPLPYWRVGDVIAHMIGTESMLLGVATPEPDIDLSGLGHVRNDIGVMNECWVRHLGKESGTELLQRFQTVTNERRKLLSDMNDADWNATTATPAGPDTYGRFMRVRIFDCWMHEQDIRDALGRSPTDADLAGTDSKLALDEMTASMGFVVGKLGGAPEGSRIEIELTGPLHRTVRVAVEGRARLVDDFGGAEPTSTIRLDGLLFTRLAGGRTTPDEHPDAIDVTGDEAVASRIVEHLKFVM